MPCQSLNSTRYSVCLSLLFLLKHSHHKNNSINVNERVSYCVCVCLPRAPQIDELIHIYSLALYMGTVIVRASEDVRVCSINIYFWCTWYTRAIIKYDSNSCYWLLFVTHLVLDSNLQSLLNCTVSRISFIEQQYRYYFIFHSHDNNKTVTVSNSAEYIKKISWIGIVKIFSIEMDPRKRNGTRLLL